MSTEAASSNAWMAPRHRTPEAFRMPTSRPKLRLVRPRGSRGPLPTPSLPPMRSGVVPVAIEPIDPEWHEASDSSQEDLATLRRPGTQSILSPPAAPQSSESVIEWIESQGDEYVSGTSTSVWNDRAEPSYDDIFDVDDLDGEEAPTSRGKMNAVFRQADSFSDFGEESSAENEFWLSRSGEFPPPSERIVYVEEVAEPAEVTKHASVEAMRRARDLHAASSLSLSSDLPSPFPLVAATEPFSLVPAARRSKKVRRESAGRLILKGLIWFVVGTSIGLFGAAYLQKVMAHNAPHLNMFRTETPKAHAMAASPVSAAPTTAPRAAVHAPAPTIATIPATRIDPAPSKASPKASEMAKAIAALNAVDLNRLPKAHKASKGRSSANAAPPPVAKQEAPDPERLTAAAPPAAAPAPLTGAEAIPDLDSLLTTTLAATH